MLAKCLILEKLHAIFYNVYANLHAHQQGNRISFSSRNLH